MNDATTTPKPFQLSINVAPEQARTLHKRVEALSMDSSSELDH